MTEVRCSNQQVPCEADGQPAAHVFASIIHQAVLQGCKRLNTHVYFNDRVSKTFSGGNIKAEL